MKDRDENVKLLEKRADRIVDLAEMSYCNGPRCEERSAPFNTVLDYAEERILFYEAKKKEEKAARAARKAAK